MTCIFILPSLHSICGNIPEGQHTHQHTACTPTITETKNKVKHNSVFPSVKKLSSELDLNRECSWQMLLFEFLAVTVCCENCKTKNIVIFGVVKSRLKIESGQHT